MSTHETVLKCGILKLWLREGGGQGDRERESEGAKERGRDEGGEGRREVEREGGRPDASV